MHQIDVAWEALALFPFFFSIEQNIEDEQERAREEPEEKKQLE